METPREFLKEIFAIADKINNSDKGIEIMVLIDDAEYKYNKHFDNRLSELSAKDNTSKANKKIMTNKEYFMQEMKMTDEQLERLWDFYQKNVVCKDSEAICPTRSFLVEYQFSTIGTAKIANFDNIRFWIDEEEFNP